MHACVCAYMHVCMYTNVCVCVYVWRLWFIFMWVTKLVFLFKGSQLTPFDTDMKYVVPSMFVVIILLQVEMARPYCKFAARPSSLGKIPYVVEKVCSVLTLSWSKVSVWKCFPTGFHVECTIPFRQVCLIFIDSIQVCTLRCLNLRFSSYVSVLSLSSQQ